MVRTYSCAPRGIEKPAQRVSAFLLGRIADDGCAKNMRTLSASRKENPAPKGTGFLILVYPTLSVRIAPRW